MLGFLRKKEKLFLAISFLVLGLFSSFLWNNPAITGNTISVSSSVIPYISLIFLFASLFLFISQRKNLEAIMIPTGPSKKIDEQRALAGVRAYEQNPDRLVIISGILNNGKFLGSQSSEIYKVLRKAGVPRGQIEIEGKSKDTLETVRYTSEILNKEKIQRLYVATDLDHARRISMLFQRAKYEGLIPENLRVRPYSRGIDKAYSKVKSQVAYGKDFLKSVRTGRIRGL